METHLFPRIIEIGAGKSSQIQSIIEKNFGSINISLITGGKRVKRIAEKIASHFDFRISTFSLENTLTEDTRKIEKNILKQKTGLIIGIGGGSILDIGKSVACHINIPFLSFPTTLSNDGIYSPVVVIKNNKRIEREWTPLPEGIIVDTDIIKKAPYNTILAGIGDLMANLSAVKDWQISSRHTDEPINYEALYLSKAAAEKFMYYILCQKSYDKSVLIRKLTESLIMSGISMAVAGSSRPASGSEHLISHCLDRILKKSLMHGIQTGISTIFTLSLQNSEYLPLVKNLYKALSFPLHLSELSIDKSTFISAIKCSPKIRKRFTVLNIRSEKAIEKTIESSGIL